MITLIVYNIGWAGVAYAGFCRAQKLGPESRNTVRISIGLFTAAAVAMLIAPYVWMIPMQPLHAALGLSLTCFFLSVKPSWDHGVPPAMNKKKPSGEG